VTGKTVTCAPLKAGALYFALVFAAGWVFGPIRELWVIPRLGRTAGFLLEAPLMLAVMIAAARWTLRKLAVPYLLKTRLAIGLVALGILLIAEVMGVLWVRRLSVPDYLASSDSVSGGVSLVSFVLFAAMPILVARR
jgi:hypothetical protein